MELSFAWACAPNEHLYCFERMRQSDLTRSPSLIYLQRPPGALTSHWHCVPFSVWLGKQKQCWRHCGHEPNWTHAKPLAKGHKPSWQSPRRGPKPTGDWVRAADPQTGNAWAPLEHQGFKQVPDLPSTQPGKQELHIFLKAPQDNAVWQPKS